MRVHPAVVLVLVALVVPFVVEARTMLVWVGIDLSVAQTIVLGVVVVALILGWALYPERSTPDRGTC